MGSGRGKARRVRAVANSSSVRGAYILARRQKWLDFINGSGIDNLQIGSYYLEGPYAAYTIAEYVRMLEGLFSDAVAVGAVVLPAPFASEDFEVNVAFLDGEPSYTAIVVKESGAEVELPNPQVYLSLTP